MFPFTPQRKLPPASPLTMPSKQKIMLAGISFEPRLSGALHAPDHETLIVSDMHLEHGASLARRGIHIPPFDTASTLQLLEREVQALKPNTIIFLGDAFHDRVAHTLLPDDHRLRLVGLLHGIATIWITGNHDPDPPTNLPGISVTDHRIASITLRHEPERRGRNGYEIAGHLHPGATIARRGASTRAKCFVADATRIILPAFGAYTGALSVHSRAFANLLDVETAKLWMIGKTAIHPVPMKTALA
jgi:uncharacterized protein